MKITLPDNYPITETTHQNNFRNPHNFFNANITKVLPLRPQDTLKSNEKERKILRVRLAN
jgi:hypothetical protein